MQRSQLLTLPAKKLVAPTSGQEFSWHDCLTAKVQDSGLPGWKGLLTNHHPLTTPVLYHRGSWLVSQGFDPEHRYPLQSGDSCPFTTYNWTSREYGGTFGARAGATLVPSAILFGGHLTTDPSNPVDDWTFGARALDGLTGLLSSKGVFAGSLSMGGVSANQRTWLVNHFPPTSLTSQSGGFGTFSRITVSADNWTGGSLLVLMGIYLAGYVAVVGSPITPGTPDPNTWYYSTNAPYTLPTPSTSPVLHIPDEHPPAPDIILNSAQFAIDQAQFLACAAKFNRLKLIAYLRTPSDTSHIVSSEVNVLTGFNAALDGVAVKGPYSEGFDLTATIQDDVREFFL